MQSQNAIHSRLYSHFEVQIWTQIGHNRKIERILASTAFSRFLEEIDDSSDRSSLKYVETMIID